MPKKYTGKKSTTKKSTGARPSAFASRGSDDGSYQGVMATKSPTGRRPVYPIATGSPPEVTEPGPTKAPITHTPMPAENRKRDRLTGRPRSEGGSGSY